MKYNFSRTKKLMYIVWLSALSLIAVLGLCSCSGSQGEVDAQNGDFTGLKVTAAESDSWKYDTETNKLTVMKDGVTVSGTVEDDILIECYVDVSELSLNGVQQGEHSVSLKTDITDKDMVIDVSGDNDIDNVLALGDMTIKGTKNSGLDIGKGIFAAEDLVLQDVKIRTKGLVADNDMSIYGSSDVKVDINGEDFSDLITSAAKARHDILIDLSAGGRFEVTSDRDEGGFIYAGNRLSLGKSIEITNPSGSIVDHASSASVKNGEADKKWQLITDKTGGIAYDVVMEGTN